MNDDEVVDGIAVYSSEARGPVSSHFYWLHSGQFKVEKLKLFIQVEHFDYDSSEENI